MTDYSLLDLSPIPQGGSAAGALAATLDLARHAEAWGFRRFWLAEHHNMPGIASAATAVVIAHVAAGTRTIRVGAGGIMLPNHAPLQVAEAFGTLEALHPGRIDLGLGRAPGTDQATAMALRRTRDGGADRFPDDVLEILSYLDDTDPGAPVKAVPGQGSGVPVWILGSSLFGAQLAALLGLPYAFASHFAPAEMERAVALYRSSFQPSARLDRPHVMLGLNVFAADTQNEARVIRTSAQQSFVNLRRGRPGPLPPPDPDFESRLAPSDRAILDRTLSATVVGDRVAVAEGLAAFLERTGADELMLVSHVFDHRARLRSLEIAADALSGAGG